MSFTITDSDGNISKEIWSCTECVWLSTKAHCTSDEDGPTCVLCGSPCEQRSTITKSTGMAAFKYQQLLARLEDDATGVGAGTVANIRDHFESGDAFLDAAEAAYQEMDFTELEAVDGVGQSSATEIGLTMADEEGWEDGALFSL